MASKAAKSFRNFNSCIFLRRPNHRPVLINRVSCLHGYVEKRTQSEKSSRGAAGTAASYLCRRSFSSRTRIATKSSLLFSYRSYLFVPFVCFDNRTRSQSSHPKRPLSRTHFYNVLKVTPNATQSQIKEAYYQLSKVFHPDINKEENAQIRFAEISEAYEVLGNARKRRMYDRGVINPTTYTGDEDDSGFHSQEGFTAKKRHAPTGKSNVYNFDEFYRQHYGTSRKKQSNTKGNYEAYMRQLEEEQQHKKMNMLLMTMILTIMFIAWYASMSDLNNISKQKKKKD